MEKPETIGRARQGRMEDESTARPPVIKTDLRHNLFQKKAVCPPPLLGTLSIADHQQIITPSHPVFLAEGREDPVSCPRRSPINLALELSGFLPETRQTVVSPKHPRLQTRSLLRTLLNWNSACKANPPLLPSLALFHLT